MVNYGKGFVMHNLLWNGVPCLFHLIKQFSEDRNRNL